MALSNYERLIQLADEVFSVKSDPSQLDVNLEVLEKLTRLHPATVSAFDDGNGPVAWVLLIPTTLELMYRFLAGEISEKELFNLTQPDTAFEVIYLCSVLVLEEYRRKGITKNLALSAIAEIRKEYQLKAALVWAFSKEGDQAAETIAQLAELPLYKKLK